jgi:copper resistance protein C
MRLTTLLGLCAFALTPCLALAHAHVERTDPPMNGVVHASPATIRITFSEPVTLSFSGVRVTDAAGHIVPLGKSTLEPRDRKIMVTPTAATLSAGAYSVRWHAVAADTHRTEGSFGFRVVP